MGEWTQIICIWRCFLCAVSQRSGNLYVHKYLVPLENVVLDFGTVVTWSLQINQIYSDHLISIPNTWDSTAGIAPSQIHGIVQITNTQTRKGYHTVVNLKHFKWFMHQHHLF